MNKPLNIGKFGESLAENYLNGKGYKTLVKNFRVREGELDLIMMDLNYHAQIVVVEVKTTTLDYEFYGNVREKITKSKIRKMILATEMFLYRYFKNNAFIDWRLDVVVVQLNTATKKSLIQHYKDITNG